MSTTKREGNVFDEDMPCPMRMMASALAAAASRNPHRSNLSLYGGLPLCPRRLKTATPSPQSMHGRPKVLNQQQK